MSEITLDTRALKKLMRDVENPPTKYVADGVDYGIHHEFGTYKMAARPWMRPAVETVRPMAGKVIERHGLSDIGGAIAELAVLVQAHAQVNILNKNIYEFGALINSVHVQDGKP